MLLDPDKVIDSSCVLQGYFFSFTWLGFIMSMNVPV